MDQCNGANATRIKLTDTESICYGAFHKSPSTKNSENISYWKLLQSNREFRLFITSFLITHGGEWLTYIACIDFIENQLGKSNTTSRTAISLLIACRLLPNFLLSSFGGTLADSRDRRESMIFLDICGAICALLFVVAYQLESIFLIYVMSFLQESIAGLYQPCCSSIIPLMVKNEQALKKATTLSGLAWSVMAAVGSASGGFVVAAFGIRNCFCKWTHTQVSLANTGLQYHTECCCFST
jgi:predicted MFS family arabinose efflux permease